MGVGNAKKGAGILTHLHHFFFRKVNIRGDIMKEFFFVINTLNCSTPFSGTWEECNDYLDAHPDDSLAGTLTICSSLEDIKFNFNFITEDDSEYIELPF